jgi:methionine synthase II (cobalamin-independent)
MPRIRTTVVGSYPIPDWLVANPSEQALMDRVVISTQEQAGVDVVCDGELYRFDINHPETNGMIEYFVRPMDGITQRFSFDDLIASGNDMLLSAIFFREATHDATFAIQQAAADDLPPGSRAPGA